MQMKRSDGMHPNSWRLQRNNKYEIHVQSSLLQLERIYTDAPSCAFAIAFAYLRGVKNIRSANAVVDLAIYSYTFVSLVSGRKLEGFDKLYLQERQILAKLNISGTDDVNLIPPTCGVVALAERKYVPKGNKLARLSCTGKLKVSRRCAYKMLKHFHADSARNLSVLPSRKTNRCKETNA